MDRQSFGKYTVIQRLGTGGMAVVYQGYHPDLDRRVAIKVIHAHLSTDPDFDERFRREARLVASLRHPHIVQLYDFDVADGQPYMVMEYLDGGTLKERLAQIHAHGETMSLDETLRLLEPIAGALDYAHTRGAVHRDIKPANILFTSAGEPVLTDFGIAKILSGLTQLSHTGSIVGTPVYMSPEQAASRTVDARSDIYSLGVIVYEMVTGRVPFEGDTLTAVIMMHLKEPPPPLRQFNPNLPEAVEAVILKALAKDPAERFAAAGDLAQALRLALSGDLPTQVDRRSAAEEATLLDELHRPTAVEPRAAERSLASTASEVAAASMQAVSQPPIAMPALAPAETPARVPAARRWLVPAAIVAGIAVVALGAFAISGRLRLGAAPSAEAARLRFRDGAASSLTSEAALTIPRLTAPVSGTQYQVWLLGNGDEQRRDLGVLSVSNEGTKLIYTDPSGSNLLARFDAVEITIEPLDNNPLPSGSVLLHGKLPPQALVHIRHLLVHRDDTPGNVGYAVGLVSQAQVLQKQGDLLRTALDAQDLKGISNIAEGIVNLIEGRGGEHYGDVNGDGMTNDRGDGFGLLPGRDRSGYIQGTLEHAKLAAAQPDATDGIKLHAGHVQICAQNVGEWAARLRDLALQVARASDVKSAEGAAREAVSLAGRILNGQDLNGNEEVEPIPGEGGALTAYQHAQFVADIPLSAP